MSQPVFGVWDYAIMALTMIASVAIGLYFRFSGGKQKTNEEYLLGDRNMSIVPVAVSLMASFMSAITLLGVSSENYSYGMQFVVINISYGIATPIASRYYLPVFFGLQKMSTYEYLELRFGPHIRTIASLTYTLQMVLYNGIVLYAPAIVLEAVTGLDRLISILVVGLVCTFYATLGGMKAVVWTDLLQSLLMFGAVLSVVIFSSVQLGGFGKIFTIAKESGRLDFNSFSLDPTIRNSWWSLNFGGMITYLSLYAVNHTQVQRLLTVSTLERSQTCLWLSWPVLSVLSICTCISGLGIFAVYKDCDPLAAGKISAMDQLMPYYVVDAMKSVPGLAGLFVAGIFSASLSTVSAACNALAAVTLTDYVGNHHLHKSNTDITFYGQVARVAARHACSQATMETLTWCHVRDSYIPWLTKLAACGYGLVFLALAFVAEHLGGLLQAALTIFGAVGGPMFGVFTLGMFTTIANENGVCVALLSGMALTLWISFGGPRPLPVKLPVSVAGCSNVTLPSAVPPSNPSEYFYMYRVSYLWTSPIGLVWVVVVGTLVSLAWRRPQPWQRAGAGRALPDPALFSPPLARRLRRQQEAKSDIQCELLKG